MRTRDLIVVAACILGSACSSKAPPKPAPAVRVEVVGAGKAMGSPDTYSAFAQAKETIPLAFRNPGYVVDLLQVKTPDGHTRAVGEGDRLHKGEVIARLREAEFRDRVGQATGQVAAARAAAEKARLDFERAQRLFATQSITRPEMETATAQRDGTRAQLAAAEALLAEAQVGLRDTALVVPVDADVMKKSVEPGAFTGPGMPAFIVGNVSSVKVVLGLPDVALHDVKPWQEVTVTTDALPGKTFTAKVSRIAAVADPVTRNFDVEVEIPNPDRLWKPGMIAAVELKAGTGHGPIPLLPLTAFVPSPKSREQFAVLIVDGAGDRARAKVRDVQLGNVVGNRVAVVEGLNKGEQVITTGAGIVKDGERIEVLPQEQP
ncbi:MAG TPA: efflux RND transporter periplasmic adaptor subunit [Myxococcaceae bacterium]|nr:efflux RND transporter periplasmic adaptor subunit [Myxococcaceae bacterium]